MHKKKRTNPEVRTYLLRRREAAEEVVDRVRVFSKAYNRAVDEIEEIDELLGNEEIRG